MPNPYLRSLLDRMDEDRTLIDSFQAKRGNPFEDMEDQDEESPLAKLRNIGMNMWREFNRRRETWLGEPVYETGAAERIATGLGEWAGERGRGFEESQKQFRAMAERTPGMGEAIEFMETPKRVPEWLTPQGKERKMTPQEMLDLVMMSGIDVGIGAPMVGIARKGVGAIGKGAGKAKLPTAGILEPGTEEGYKAFLANLPEPDLPYAKFLRDIGRIQSDTKSYITRGKDTIITPIAQNRIIERAIQAFDEKIIGKSELRSLVEDFYQGKPFEGKSADEIIAYFRGKPRPAVETVKPLSKTEVDNLIEETFKLPEVPVAPVGKEPWQMTRDEVHRKATELLTPGAEGKPFTAERQALLNKQVAYHKTLVSDALSEGKPVPPEVLKDYPDLAARVKPGEVPVSKAEGAETLSKISEEMAFTLHNMGYDWKQVYKFTPEQANDIVQKGVKAPVSLMRNLTMETDIGALIKENGGDFSVTVKDVNGARMTMNASDFDKLRDNQLFTDRVREVFVSGMKPVAKITGNPKFMSGLIIKGQLAESAGKVKQIGSLADIGGVKLSSTSSVTSTQQRKFVEMITDERVRTSLKDLGIKEVIIEPPYKFTLSEQANISVKTGILRINADATDPIATIFHELGHAKFEALSDAEKASLRQSIRQSTDPRIQGYLKTGNVDEAIAESLLPPEVRVPPVKAAEVPPKPVVSPEIPAKVAKPETNESMLSRLREAEEEANAAIRNAPEEQKQAAHAAANAITKQRREAARAVELDNAFHPKKELPKVEVPDETAFYRGLSDKELLEDWASHKSSVAHSGSRSGGTPTQHAFDMAELSNTEREMARRGLEKPKTYHIGYETRDTATNRSVEPLAAERPPVSPELPVTEAKPPVAPARALETPLEPPPPKEPPTAVAAGPEPKPPMKEGFAVNIRLEKFPSEIQGDIKAWADANPEIIDQARRGVVTLEQTEANARTLIEQTGGNPDKLIKRVGEAYNDAEIRAISGLLAKSHQELRAIRDLIASGQNSNENVLRLAQLMEKTNYFQLAAHASRAEAGRALSSLRMINEALESKSNVIMEKVLKQLGNRADYEKIAEAMKGLNWDDPIQVNNFIRQIVKPHAADYVYEIFINSILSGPKTHIVNTTTNIVSAAVSPIERAAASLIDIPLAKLQKRLQERFLSEVFADAVGALTAIPDGLRAFLKTWQQGMSPTAVSKYEFRPSAFSGKLGRVINAPVTGLEAADSFIYTVNYKAAFDAEVIRAARKTGLKGKDLQDFIIKTQQTPPAELITKASKIANERAFRGEPGEFTSALYKMRRAVKIGNVEPLKYVVPFIRTPVNLLKFGIERSPLGLGNPKLWSNLANKNPEAADQLARVLLGSLVAGGIGWYFGNGRITGAAPRNPNERNRFYLEGKIPYAVKIGDTWVSYQRLEPFNQVFTQVAAGVQAIEDNAAGLTEKLGNIAQTIAQNFISQTYMSSIADVIDAIAAPERYGVDWLERFVVAMAVPYSAFTRTIAQAVDRTVRQPKTLGQQIQGTVPIWSRELPAKQDIFGETITRQTPWFSPISISEEQNDRLTEELSKNKVNIGFVGKSISNVPLTPEEEGLYKRTAGELAKRHILEAIESPEYARLKGEDAYDALLRAANAGKKEARDWMVENGGIAKPHSGDTPEVAEARQELTGKTTTTPRIPSSFRAPTRTPSIRRRITKSPFRSTERRVIPNPFR